MKENRDYQLKVRLTNSEKEILFEAAEAAGMSISDYVRAAIYRMVGGNK